MSKMTIVKMRFSTDARMNREAFEERTAREVYSNGVNPHMPRKRCASNAARKAMTKMAARYQRFYVNGDECRLITAERPQILTKTKGFRIDVNLQVRPADPSKQVFYTPNVFTYDLPNRDSSHMDLIHGDAWSEYGSALREAFGNPSEILRYGEENLFDSDFRAIADSMLEGHTLKLWAGVHVVLGEEAYNRVNEVSEYLSNLDEGSVRMSKLTLEDNEVNRQALAEELAEQFIDAFKDIETRAGGPGPNIDRLNDELIDISTQLSIAQEVLECTIPCEDAKADAEMALAMLAEEE